MAKRITQLPAGTPENNDVIPYVSVGTGITRKALKSELKGDAATVDVGTVSTGAPGTDVEVVNSGTTNAAVLDFTIPRGNPGLDGAEAFVYIAYADDGVGTGFTNTFNSTKDYIAILTSTVEIPTPIVSDFAGLWKKVKGETGASGVAGELPSTYQEVHTQQTTTSATLVDVPGSSHTINLDEPVNIAVFLSAECELVSGGTSILALAVNVDGVDHEESRIELAVTPTFGVISLVHRTTTPLAAGVHTVKARFRRTAGTGTVGTNDLDLLTVAMQGAKGTDATGDVIAPATNTDGFIPQWDGNDAKTLKNGLSLDTDLSSVSASDDSVPSAKATKAYADTKVAPARSITINGTTQDLSADRTFTITNLAPRVSSTSDAATVTPNADSYDCVDITAIAQAFTIANPTGTPVNFQRLMIRIKDNGTARAITWGNGYVAGGVALPSTTVLSKIMTLGFIYNTANSLNKWQLVALSQEA